MEQDRSPIEMPIAGPGMPRYTRVAPAWTVWLIPVGVLVVTALAILLGALWR